MREINNNVSSEKYLDSRSSQPLLQRSRLKTMRFPESTAL